MLILQLPLVIAKYVKHSIFRIIRHLYWLYNISRIDGLYRIQLHFPILVEGQGKIQFGSGSILKKNGRLKIAKSARLTIGRNATLSSFSDIRIAAKGQLIIGDNFDCENGSRFYLATSWNIANNVKIATNCAVFSRESGFHGTLQIGEGTHIGDNTIIDVCDNIFIGKEVAIGPNCILYTHDHDYTKEDMPAWKGGVITKPIIIENGAWIGSGVTILPGISIGERAVIAAGAVVTKSIESGSVVGGIPAKCLTNRNSKK
jgi:acetyltransferase-like isoleucine patch superfamily enzyme